MKKYFVSALALVMAFSLAACSSAEADGAMASLIRWMKSGTFSYDFEMISEGGGQKTHASGSMAMDGRDMALQTESSAGGQRVKSRVIVKDGATYIVDDANKFIMKAPGGGLDVTGGMINDWTGIAKAGEGTGEVNGKILPYEEYASNGVNSKFYLDGGQVCAIESEYQGHKTLMIITNPSSTVPKGAFDLPKGYRQM